MKVDERSARLCDRCLKEILEGAGSFIEVHVQAIADPAPPTLDSELNSQNIRSENEELVKQFAEDKACRSD